MRRPRIIWLPRARRKPRPKRPKRIAGDSRPTVSAPSPPARPRPMFWLYVSTLAVAAAILWATPSRSSRVVPVGAPTYSGLQLSWFSRALARTRVTVRAAETWIRSGIPLLALRPPLSNRIDWSSLVGAGLADLAGTPLDSLQGILAQEVPNLRAVAPPGNMPPHRIRQVSGGGAASSAGLPGDGGKIWAVLGPRPVVGVYQTLSMQSFSSELPPGTTLYYTREWDKTIVNVGWHLALALKQDGIPVVQARVNNMAGGLLAAYYTAYQTAHRLLSDFPSVRVLLDVQRGQGDAKATTAVIHGVPMARVTLMVGTGQILPDPHWRENYAFAKRLKQALAQTAPGIIGPSGIDVVPYRYNQQLLAQDLIVEIGGPDNTMAEETRSAVAVAAALKALLTP